MTDDWLERDAVRAAVGVIVAQATRQYRLDAAAAAALIRDVLARDAEFRRAAEAAESGEKLIRTRAFKDAAAAAKKHVYYSLRRYRPPASEGDAAAALEQLRTLPSGGAADARDVLARTVAVGHRSTAERLHSLDEFYAALFAAVGTPRSILDIGCGVQPLLFPFDEAGRRVERYLALDKDPQAVEAVEAYARARGDGRLSAVRSDLSGGWPAGCGEFDLALMLKLIGVVERQDRELLDVLAHAPARRWVVSGSKVALAKQQDIERRERATLRRFVELAGRRVVGEFGAGEEFALVVE
ncbi:MAG TPA: hypothetical protein VMZ71_05165 [Gemmataceae bacterium]|nr:hypothetical protein [Gemmataceae bacterium]